jgi:hypothetical protein
MKIVKTNRFLKKQAAFGDLPGDPGLPPGVTNQMIDQSAGIDDGTDYSKQSGQFEAKIDWQKEVTELINAGYDVRGLPQQGEGNLIVYYEYDADVINGQVGIQNLRLLDMKTFVGGQYQELTVSEPSTKEGIFEGLQDSIASQEQIIIREQNEGALGQGPDTREEAY